MIAKWITPVPCPDRTALYVFKKSFTLEDTVKSFNIRISADTRYRLYINGKECAHGPCQSSQHVKYYEEVECQDALIKGQNEIRVDLLHVSTNAGYSFTPAFHREKPALYFDATLAAEEGTEKIVSDESFSVFLAKHISFTHHKYTQPMIAPFEQISGDKEYEELKCEVLYIPNSSNNYHTEWGLKDLYFLKKRPIQILKTRPKADIPVMKEYYDENGNYNIILDAGVYTTAMLCYDFCAPKGTKINLIYAECMLTRKEDGSLYKDMRDNTDGVIEYGIPDYDHYDELVASGNSQTFEPFWYRAFRFIRVECSNKPEYFRAVGGRYTYDFEKDAVEDGIGKFECSDEKYSRLWEVSRNTLECCTHETFADCPFYEQQQYIGDGRFESLYAWKLSNDSLIQKKLIIDSAHSLQTDGQIASTSPNSWVQIIHTSSFYFISLIREYLRFTGDSAFVKSMIGAISSNIGYFESTKTHEGLINPPDGWHFIDWVSSWENGFPKGGDKSPTSIYNLMYASVLKDAAEICEACEYNGLASDYRLLHAKTVEAVNKHCFDKEIGLYADIPGGKTYSEHSSVWAILSDAITGKAAYNLAEKTMNCDFVAKSSFSRCYDLLRALDKVGLYEKYASNILKQWDVMLNKHCSTWCESLSFPRSECHGWSCIPLYEISSMILGITPIENGFKKVRIKPCLMGLSYAKGRVPTPYGYIDVSWALDNGSFFLEATSNTLIEMEIILPSGKTETAITDHYIITE